jgi:hypothetical protein
MPDVQQVQGGHPWFRVLLTWPAGNFQGVPDPGCCMREAQALVCGLIWPCQTHLVGLLGLLAGPHAPLASAGLCNASCESGDIADNFMLRAFQIRGGLCRVGERNAHMQHWLRGMLACCRMRSSVPGRDSSALASWLNITARLAASPSAASSWGVPISGGACPASAEQYLRASSTSREEDEGEARCGPHCNIGQGMGLQSVEEEQPTDDKQTFSIPC